MATNDAKNNYISLITEFNRAAIILIILALQSKIISHLVKQHLINKIIIHLFLCGILLSTIFGAFLTYKILIYKVTEGINYKKFIGWLVMVAASSGLTIYNTKGDVMFLEYAVGAVTFIAMMMYGLLTKNVDLSKNCLIAMATIGIFTSLAIGIYLEYTYNDIQTSIIMYAIMPWVFAFTYNKQFNA
jgi:hypothetical protein